jgi:hypothetical protein
LTTFGLVAAGKDDIKLNIMVGSKDLNFYEFEGAEQHQQNNYDDLMAPSMSTHSSTYSISEKESKEDMDIRALP